MTASLAGMPARVSVGPGIGGVGGWAGAILAVAVLGALAWWVSRRRRR